MKLSQMNPGQKTYTQLGSKVLAVLSRRVDGWCVYVDAVPGVDHEMEWYEVSCTGQKQKEPIAKAIVENLFYPGFEVDLPYAS